MIALDNPTEYLNQPYDDNGTITTLLQVFQNDLKRQLANRKKTDELKRLYNAELGNPESVISLNEQNIKGNTEEK